MNAEIVSVGTELLLGQIVDTHAPRMAQILADCGIGCTRRVTIGDNWDRLVGALQESLGRCDVLITIGGLGPTVDDLTRDAIAAALGDSLEVVPEVEEKLRKFFALRDIPWNETIGRQAQKPTSAILVENPNGTAPGLFCQKDGKVVLALPGPKGEFDPMADGPVREILSRLQGDQVIHSRVLRICNMGESQVELVIRDLMDGDSPSVAPYAHLGEVHLRVTARAASVDAANAVIDPMETEIRRRIGTNVFGTDSTSLEMAVGDLLLAQGATVSVAESMTGGELAARLSGFAGSSKVFLGGMVTYSVAVKGLAGVRKSTLEKFGPVSEQVASEMAEGVRSSLGSTYSLSITGNAGPTSDVDGKPVGLVHIGCSGPSGTSVQEVRYRGLRSDIRRRATQTALVMLREELLGSDER